MKKVVALFLIIACLSVFDLQAQETVKKYILHFPEYPIEDIKPLVFLTQPLFNDTNIEIYDDNYKQFVYRSKIEVTEESLRKVLEGTKFNLIRLEIKENN